MALRSSGREPRAEESGRRTAYSVQRAADGRKRAGCSGQRTEESGQGAAGSGQKNTEAPDLSPGSVRMAKREGPALERGDTRQKKQVIYKRKWITEVVMR